MHFVSIFSLIFDQIDPFSLILELFDPSFLQNPRYDFYHVMTMLLPNIWRITHAGSRHAHEAAELDCLGIKHRQIDHNEHKIA